MTAAVRSLPDDTNGVPPYPGLPYQEKANNEVMALWARSASVLASVAGTNTITGTVAAADLAALGAYKSGASYWLIPANDNTGPVTLNVDSLGAKNLLDADGNALTGGALKSGGLYLAVDLGASFRVINPVTGTSRASAAPDMILRDEKTTNTAGGTATSGSYFTRTLNTAVRNVISGAALASNQFTLPSGTYYIEWSAPANFCGRHQTRLYNVTDSAVVETGTSQNGDTSAAFVGNLVSAGSAVVTITSTKVFQIEHRVQTTRATDGLGLATNLGAKEVYTVVNVWKLGQLASVGSLFRERLQGDRTYYVATTGSNSNDGLSSGTPFLTLQKAYDALCLLDLNGYVVTISVADGTYTAGISITSPWTGGGAVVIQGNVGTPANVFLNCGASACLSVTATLPGTLTIRGFKLVSTGGASTGINHAGVGTVNFSDLDFGTCTSWHMAAAASGARIVAVGNYKISAAAAAHILSLNFGIVQITGATVTLTGTPAFGVGFVYATRAGMVIAEVVTFSGSATGARYAIDSGSIVYTGGGGANYFPGNSAGVGGTTSGGGFYS